MTDRIRKEAFTDIQLGLQVQIERVFSQSDFDRFAALSGDDNPIHIDPAYAARTKFGRPVAHGMLLYSMVCAVLESYLPGARQLSQTLKFPSATFTGEKVRVQLEVIQIDLDNGNLSLDTRIIRLGGQLGLEGQAQIVFPGARWQAAQPSAPVPPSTDQTLKGLALGQTAAIRRIFSEQDLAEYGELTKVTDQQITIPKVPDQLGLERPLVPGGLLGGLFSNLLGTRLPGPGTNYLKQNISFLTPAHPGQELQAVVEISRIRADKQLINLQTTCRTGEGDLICLGEALVGVSDVEG